MDPVLYKYETAQEPEVPWTDRVDRQMDEGVGLNADGVQRPCGILELSHGTGVADQGGPG